MMRPTVSTHDFFRPITNFFEAPAFEPARPALVMPQVQTPSSGPDALKRTLLTALLEEEKALDEANLAIEALKARIKATEAQVALLVDENRTLRASKIMLEAALNDRAFRAGNSSLPTLMPLEADSVEQKRAVQEFITSALSPNMAQNCILYDVLATQRQTYQVRNNSKASPIISPAPSLAQPAQKTTMNELSIMPEESAAADFSFLSKPNQNVEKPTHKDECDRQVTSPCTQTPPNTERKLLIDMLSPHSAYSIPKSPAKPSIADAVETCHRVVQSIIKPKPTVDLRGSSRNLEPPPTLQLPASFLSKYKYRPPTKTLSTEESSNEGLPTPQPISQIENVTQENRFDKEPLVHKTLSSKSIENDGEVGNRGSANYGRPAPEHIIQSPSKNKMQKAITTPAPILGTRLSIVDVKIDWAIGKLNPLFETEEELKRLERYNENQGSHFWKHPVRFLPDSAEPNLYRTMMIDFLPAGSIYQDILSHIRTGALESIQMFPPLPRVTNFYTARVVFLDEKAAVSTIIQYQKRLNRGDPIKIHGISVRFWQVLVPTYPTSKELEIDIFKHGYTRILLLDNLENSGVLPKLHEKIAPELTDGNVVKIAKTSDGVPMIEFTSVTAATRAMRRMQADGEFRGCTFDFDRDYCDSPFEIN